ncbi:P-loop containing nucleoside triphosphate hydrolase protein [Haematococcus lacustris]
MACCLRPRAEEREYIERHTPSRATAVALANAAAKAKPYPIVVHCEAEAAPLPAIAQAEPVAPIAPKRDAEQLYENTEYAMLAHRMVSTVDAMRSAGAHAVLDLPQIVVCGNQSAGKSSVLEALCGVALPRSDGTCTRCPLEARMSSSPVPGPSNTVVLGGSCSRNQWKARVLVRREWGPDGQKLASPVEEVVQAGILHPGGVEPAVRRAQELLLQPSASGQPLMFTRNTVVLEVECAPVSLTLVDLPGIIHAVEAPVANCLGSPLPDYPELVTGLVREYASRPSAIIVAVVTCKEDLDTQGVLGLVRELDPSGSRTLGVLTKPDMIEPGCHAAWLDVLQGNRWPLALGYYCVRNPSQSHVMAGMDSATARSLEAAFFSQTQPWAQLSNTPLACRLGSTRLRNALAQLLADLAQRSLPALQATAQQRLAAVEAVLAQLPPSMSQPQMLGGLRPAPAMGLAGASVEVLHAAMANMVDDVCGHIARQLAPHSSTSSTPVLASPSPALPKASPRNAIGTPDKNTPRSTPRNSSMSARSALGGRTDTDSGGATGSPNRPGDRALWGTLMSHFEMFKTSVYASKPSFIVGSTLFSCTTDIDAAGDGICALPVDSGMTGDSGTVMCPGSSTPPLSLEDVRELVEAHRGLELPGFTSYAALRTLVTGSSSGWGDAAHRLLAASRDALSSTVASVLVQRLGRCPGVHRAARAVVTALVEEVAAGALTFVEGLVTMETGGLLPPFTLNRHGFETTCNSVLQQLSVAAMAGPEAHQSAGQGNGPAAATGSLSSLSGDQVLTMVAVALTYFTLASRRLVDNVPMHVMHYLIARFGTEIKPRLVSTLLAGRDAASLAALLQEDELTSRRRAELCAQRDALQGALVAMRTASL